LEGLIAIFETDFTSRDQIQGHYGRFVTR
jgi:hypothetical protein